MKHSNLKYMIEESEKLFKNHSILHHDVVQGTIIKNQLEIMKRLDEMDG